MIIKKNKVKIGMKLSVGQIWNNQNTETTKQAQCRADRFSKTIYKEDNIIEGNSTKTLEWAKKFFVK